LKQQKQQNPPLSGGGPVAGWADALTDIAHMGRI
jgi:hypothetical protein